jgi:hypothetical protein
LWVVLVLPGKGLMVGQTDRTAFFLVGLRVLAAVRARSEKHQPRTAFLLLVVTA